MRTVKQAVAENNIHFPKIDLSGLDKEKTLEGLRKALKAMNTRIYVCHALEDVGASEIVERIEESLVDGENEPITVIETEEFIRTTRLDFCDTEWKNFRASQATAYRKLWIQHMIAEVGNANL